MGLTAPHALDGGPQPSEPSPGPTSTWEAAQHSIRARTGDVGAAAFVVLLDTVLFTQLTEAENRGGWGARAVPVLVILLAGLSTFPPLVVRRRWPFAMCLVVAALSALLTLAIGSRPLAAPLLAVFTAAAWAPRTPAVLALVAVLSAHALSVYYEASTVARTPFAVVGVATVFVLLDLSAWAFGRRAFAVRARTRMLEESRAELEAEAIAQERLRIARELHDIVAHAVTIMVLQAAGAQRIAEQDPARAAAAMQSVVDTGNQAVSELRRLLGVLRSVGDSPEEEQDESAGLSRLEALAGQVQAAGVGVSVNVVGPVGQLDPSVEHAAYRIAQEALTNTTRHAGPGTHVDLRLRWSADALAVDVVDNGAGVRTSEMGTMSTGYGFTGLAERVKLVGGSFAAGPRTAGKGYHVSAVLPTRTRATGALGPRPESGARGGALSTPDQDGDRDAAVQREGQRDRVPRRAG